MEWESDLDNPVSSNYNSSCNSQAIAAREIITLYAWWTEIRPNRLCSDDIIDDTELPELGAKVNRADPVYIKWAKNCKNAMEIEQLMYEEDTEMLVRLMRIRDSLWT